MTRKRQGGFLFGNACGASAASLATPVYDQPMNRQDLIAASSAPGRYYHGLAFIEDWLGALEADRGFARNATGPS